MTTTSHPATLATVLDAANPENIASALQQVKLGTMLNPLKVVVSGATSLAAQPINGANILANATVYLDGSASGVAANTVFPGGLPPIASVKTLRDAHSNIVVDSGGAAVASTSTYPGTVLLSDDGTTLTFAAAVTAFTIEYTPKAGVAMSAAFANQTGLTNTGNKI